MNDENKIDTKQINSFLKEGSEWFKSHHLPQAFPAFIAQIPDSINKLTVSLEKQSNSNDRLSSSIKYATWFGVSITGLTLVWDLIKAFCIK
jgi:hypothetical protein